MQSSIGATFNGDSTPLCDYIHALRSGTLTVERFCDEFGPIRVFYDNERNKWWTENNRRFHVLERYNPNGDIPVIVIDQSEAEWWRLTTTTEGKSIKCKCCS